MRVMNDVSCRLCADAIAMGNSEICSECAQGIQSKECKARESTLLEDAVEAVPGRWKKSMTCVKSMQPF